MRLAGWGNYPVADCRTVEARGRCDMAAAVKAEPSLIARGNGRAYGDAALNPKATLLTRRHDRILAFDEATGRITCESGVLLADLLDVFVHKGWFPPVTPGTKFVTVGGMVAADVHGKNHHRAGSFARHVEALELILPDGRIVTCSAEENPDLFAATCGGMGLTGVIVWATFRLQRIETAWIRQEIVRCENLDAAMDAFEASAGWTYSVAWIDCLARGRAMGRAVLNRGEHATLADLDPTKMAAPLTATRRPMRRVPIMLPSITLNSLSVRAFNQGIYWYGRSRAELVGYDSFFYPLDVVLDWNRVYGRGGFTQYQCVLPKEASRNGLTSLLDLIGRSGMGSFLGVLKLFGSEGAGLLSFPMEGYTLSLDFPVRKGTLALLTELDSIVADHGGRIYLAKDARMGPDMLRRGYPKLSRFIEARCRGGATHRFASAMSERLGL